MVSRKTVSQASDDAQPRPVGGGTRERLVAAMAQALRRRGYHGVGLSELLDQAQAPKGVLYHHFPGGKSALAVAAIEATVELIVQATDAAVAGAADPLDAMSAWMASAQRVLEGSRFEIGCPLATVALESGVEDTEIRQALADGFARLRERLGAALRAGGFDAARSAGLAALVVAAYEGALIQARVAGDVAPMAAVSETLLQLLQQARGDRPARGAGSGAVPGSAALPDTP